MAYPSVTYTFVNATTASASEVNQNFTDLINGMSDGTKDLNINALTAAGTATFNGAVNLGNATGDDVTVTGYLASALIPKTDDTYDLGTAALAWQDGYFDGNVYTDSILELTSANGVVIDGVKCKDNNIEATTSGGLVIKDDGGNACVTCADGSGVTLGASPSTSSVQPHIINVSGLPTGSAASKDVLSLVGSNGNTDNLITRFSRTGTGSSWTDCTWECRRKVDTVDCQFVKFIAGNDIEIGSGTTVHASSASGAWTLGPSSGLTGYHEVKNQAAAGAANTRFNKSGLSGGTTSSYFLSFAHGATDEGYIWHDAGGNMAFANASDARLKQNIREITGLDKCLSLHPVMFDWKDGTGTDNLGFIAQEVEIVLPKSVGLAPDGDTKVLSMQSEIIPILVKAIQELSVKLDEANARIAALEAR